MRERDRTRKRERGDRGREGLRERWWEGGSERERARERERESGGREGRDREREEERDRAYREREGEKRRDRERVSDVNRIAAYEQHFPGIKSSASLAAARSVF